MYRDEETHTLPTFAKISLIESPVTENGRLPTKTYRGVNRRQQPSAHVQTRVCMREDHDGTIE